MKVEYDSNNSGGHWWLKDDDWRALEKAGWKVEWEKDKRSNKGEERFLGALATGATLENVASLEAAVEQWESVTRKSASAAGCPCCGNPHNFTLYDDDGKYVTSGPSFTSVASWD